MVNKWYVITGGPSTGKTTLLNELEKLGHMIVPEAARTWIDQELARGLTIEQIRADEEAFQHAVMKLKDEIEDNLESSVTTFLDRGKADTWAYLRHYGYESPEWIDKSIQDSGYQKVFLLDPLETYEKDYARTEDADFTDKITDLLEKAYTEAGQTPVRVPALPVKERLDFILQHVG